MTPSDLLRHLGGREELVDVGLELSSDSLGEGVFGDVDELPSEDV